MQERDLVSMNLRWIQLNHLQTIQSVKFRHIKHGEMWECASLGHSGGICFAIGCLGRLHHYVVSARIVDVTVLDSLEWRLLN